MNEQAPKRQPGRPALPPELKRTARLSMRTYQDVADKAARVGTAAVEAAIRHIKDAVAVSDRPNVRANLTTAARAPQPKENKMTDADNRPAVAVTRTKRQQIYVRACRHL